MAPVALDRAVAPVDHDDRACDVSRQIRSQKGGGAYDILRFAGATKRRVLEKDAHEVGMVGAYLGIQGRFDQPRTNGIDAHTLLAELGGERAGEAQYPVLGGGVGGRVWRAHVHEGLDRTMLMMRPRRCRRSSRKACVTLNIPLRLTAMMSCQSLTTAAGSPVKALRRLMPALLTRTQTRPTLAPTAAAKLRQAALSLTSSAKLHALPPSLLNAAAVCSAVSALASSATTAAPALA